MTENFKFRAHDSIGAAGAEEDEKFLSKCFFDTGVLPILSDVSDRRCILLGRTGSGKSATLLQMQKNLGQRAIFLSPSSLSITYLTNSNTLHRFIELCVNLDPFFKMLWKHVITVEILKRNFDITSEDSQQGFIAKLNSLFSNRTDRSKQQKVKRAIDYLTNWGSKFWVEPEYRVQEITEVFEEKLTNEAKGFIAVKGLAKAELGQEWENKLSKENKEKLTRQVQKAVSETQAKDLEYVMTMLDEVLDDRQKRVFPHLGMKCYIEPILTHSRNL